MVLGWKVVQYFYIFKDKCMVRKKEQMLSQCKEMVSEKSYRAKNDRDNKSYNNHCERY